MFQKIAKHRANDASNDVHRPPLPPTKYKYKDMEETIMFEQVNGVADCTVSSSGHTLVTPTRAAHDLVLFAMYLLLLTVFAF